MMNKNVKRNTALIFAGLAVGAAAGILLAPKSGRETRSDIWRGAKAGYRRGGFFWRRIRGHREAPVEFVLDDEGILAGRC